MRKLFESALVALILVPSVAFAQDYLCTVTSKFDNAGNVYDQAYLDASKFSVIIRENGDAIKLGRCSYAASVGKVTCDFYEVDKVVHDQIVGHRKYYVFRSQFDVQVFASGRFVENNGRGSIAFGDCEKI